MGRAVTCILAAVTALFLLGAGTWAKAAQQDLADATDKVSQEEQQQMQQELLLSLIHI